VTPVLTEMTRTADGDEWMTEWYCDPPALRITFQVVRDEWANDGPPVRKIFEIKLTGS
jgi:hypothetical protein